MIDRSQRLPIARQAKLLGLARSTVYHQPRPIPDGDLALMHQIDALHLAYPFAGSRMLRDLLHDAGHPVGRRHTRTLMRCMALHALYRKPRTTVPTEGRQVYPYLLRDVAVDHANQVWSIDITYIPMARGFVYLAAVVDWYSRRVLAWRLSNTMTLDFCIEAVSEALARYGAPEIFNSDQGSQFTSPAFLDVLTTRGVHISMDGKGRWRDNVFVERLWRSVKYEEVYLHAYDSVAAARTGLARYFAFYNTRRPHTALHRRTPEQVYFASLPLPEAA